MKKPLLILILLISLNSCQGNGSKSNYQATEKDNQAKELLKSCCNECSMAFGQSPAAIGKEGAQCGHFTTAKPLSAQCQDFFAKQPKTVAVCEIN
jgi:hypothetical protein